MAGTLVIDTLKSSTTGPTVFQNTSGTQIGTLCRAWVRFDGTTGAISGSGAGTFNVSSITKSSTGIYQVNYTNAMSDTNYSQFFSSNANSTLNTSQPSGGGWTTTTYTRFETRNSAGTYYDGTECSASIFR